jgi:3'(2'), 5'-bisphosphate nucleotidase
VRRPNDPAALLPDVVEIVEEAGAAVLVVYAQNDYAVREKAGRGSVPRVGLAAHDLLVARLGTLVPHIPIVSEESLAQSYTESRAWLGSG